MTTWIYDYNYQHQQQLADIFPETNYLLQLCNLRQESILHFWQSYPCVILGLQDKHLADLTAGLKVLHQAQYAAFIRNSGGLAVISEPGVLNVSYFIPQISPISINQAYQQVFDQLQNAFSELDLKHYEIKHSYCPGEYDIVLHDKKIGGIAQRRHQQAIVVMIYLSINGNQPARGQLLRQFYQVANIDHKTTYPDVWPQTMANFQDFWSQPLTIKDCKQRLIQSYKRATMDLQVLTPQILAQNSDFQTVMQKEHERQKRLNHSIWEE